MKETIKAVYNEDLKKVLGRFNEYSEIEKGNRFCKICGSLINTNNIQLIIPYKNQSFEYVCNSIDCVEKYHNSKS